MLKVKKLFPDVDGLHSRINSLMRNSSVGRVALVSPLSRLQSKPLLDALLSEPIDDAHWFPSLRDRPLSKDILVSQADNFEFIQTRNSLTEFPVPFTGPPIEVLEVSDGNTDHIETADLLVTLLGRGQQPKATDFPIVYVQNDDFMPPSHDANNFIVSLDKALKADELLRKSPKNISSYLDLHALSGVKPLKDRIFRQVPDLRHDLLQSVATTCRRLIAESKAEQAHSSRTTERAAQLRTAWTRDAHQDLQVMLGRFQYTLSSRIAWYALYYRVDDVETVLTDVPVLPQSRVALEYASGHIDALVSAPHTQRPSVSFDVLTANIRAAAVSLHNTALKSLATNVLGVQAPILAVAGAGVYFEQFSAYSMASVAALGLAVGFNRLQKSWMAACSKFLKTVDTQGQAAIAQSERALWEIYEEKRSNQAQHLLEQQAVVDELARSVQETASATTSQRAVGADLQ